MTKKPQNDDFSRKVGVVTENVTRAAIATGAVVVEKTMDAASAIGKVAGTVAESKPVKGAVSYVQDTASQAVDYLTGKSEESTAKDESKKHNSGPSGKSQSTAKKHRKPRSATTEVKASKSVPRRRKSKPAATSKTKSKR